MLTKSFVSPSNCYITNPCKIARRAIMSTVIQNLMRFREEGRLLSHENTNVYSSYLKRTGSEGD
jgi:hypothetical protein